MRDQEQLLFQGIELSRLLLDWEDAARATVNQMPDADVSTALDHVGLCENIIEPFRITVATLEPETRRAFEEEAELNDGFGGRFPGTRKFGELTVPFLGDAASFRMRPPSNLNHTVLRAAISGNKSGGTLRLVISLDNKQAEQARVEFDAYLRELKGTLEALRSDCRVIEDQLRAKVLQFLADRRRRISDLDDLSQRL